MYMELDSISKPDSKILEFEKNVSKSKPIDLINNIYYYKKN